MSLSEASAAAGGAPRWEVEDRSEGVRVLTLHNERKRNALDTGLLEQLAEAIALDATGIFR